MTQQSLIARLKAAEEALEYAEHRLASSQPEVARDTRTHISEPLFDLRELIKEVEDGEARSKSYYFSGTGKWEET